MRQLIYFNIVLFFVLTLGTKVLNAQDFRIAFSGNLYTQLYPYDLWNLSIQNKSGAKANVYLKAEIKDRSLNVLVSLTSYSFELATGMNSLNSVNVKTRDIHYSDYNLMNMVEKIRSLPAGSYISCVEIYDDKTAQRIGMHCQESDLSVYVPPYLVYPADRQNLNQKHPVFTWTPPMPVKAGVNIKYNIRIVEMSSGQSADKAMKRNPVYYEAYGLTTTAMPYPVNATEFNRGKTYAWKVDAYMEDYYVGTTEVWEFDYRQSISRSTPVGESYAILNESLDGTYHNFENYIRFKIDKKDVKTNTMTYKVFRSNGVNVTPSTSFDYDPGTKVFEIDVSANTDFDDQEYYTLVVTLDNKNYYLKFKYIAI